MTGAWAQGNVGRDDVLIAYIEGGVNYRSNDGIKDALDNIYLNQGELPVPRGGRRPLRPAATTPTATAASTSATTRRTRA